MDENGKGFVNGGFFSADYLRDCVTAWVTGPYASFKAPSQVIGYLSCHDDWTLWDKLVCTMRERRQFNAQQPDILRANRLAAAINFCCQGYPFFQAGEEFGRTKNGVKNSYCSLPAINQIDWTRTWENHGLVEYYRGLIALRKQLPCLQDKSEQAHQRVLETKEPAPGCAQITLDNHEGTAWDRICLLVNTTDADVPVSTPDGAWEVLVTDRSSFKWQDHSLCDRNTVIHAKSALVLGRRKEAKKA